jgi:hypothetical protein
MAKDLTELIARVIRIEGALKRIKVLAERNEYECRTCEYVVRDAREALEDGN